MRLAFKPLGALGLGIDGESVGQAFQPFLCTGPGHGRYDELTRYLRRKAVKKAFRRLYSGEGGLKSRKRDIILDEYESAWSRGHSAYDLSLGCQRPEPWIHGEHKFLADRAGVPRFRSVMLAAVLRMLRPRRVLEVGCGNGVNLLLIANAFPEIEFCGLDLTEAGVRMAREVQVNQFLPAALAAYAPEPQIDPAAFRRIDFRQGDAVHMPFETGAFDLVFTVLSVEQMERVRHQALAEIARVSRGHVLNLEPFREANKTWWRRMHVWVRDYFKGSVADLPRYGLEPLWATMDFPQELQLGAALVLSRKGDSMNSNPDTQHR
jgi:SAM-dependent methyltransferase